MVRTQLALQGGADRLEHARAACAPSAVTSPGWVLITLMTAGLVTVLWAVARTSSSTSCSGTRWLGHRLSGRRGRRAPGRRRDERGAAVVDFALVSVLVLVLFLAVLQLGFALYVRNTLISCASEGARYGARAGAVPGHGVARARDLVTASLSPRYAAGHPARVATSTGCRW